MCNMREAWSESTSRDEVCRRAAGRRHYNSVRRFRATARRAEVMRLLCVQGSMFERGTQARLARQLGVSRSTVCRDMAFLMRLGRPCPHCGAFSTPPEPEFPYAYPSSAEEPDRAEPVEAGRADG